MKARFRLIVEWWDTERQRTVTVCDRIFLTHKGANDRLNKYLNHSRECYRGSIQFLGYS